MNLCMTVADCSLDDLRRVAQLMEQHLPEHTTVFLTFDAAGKGAISMSIGLSRFGLPELLITGQAHEGNEILALVCHELVDLKANWADMRVCTGSEQRLVLEIAGEVSPTFGQSLGFVGSAPMMQCIWSHGRSITPTVVEEPQFMLTLVEATSGGIGDSADR